jgi:hypothetical protein
MSEVFEGGCQCGSVRYRVTGQALTLFACHCKECQRQSASAFGMALWVRTSSVALLSGELKTWVRSTPSGRKLVCQFCPACGSRVFHQSADQNQILSIKPGTLDDTSWLRPAAHIWSRSAQSWVSFGQECLVYAANPESFEKVVERWQEVNG